MKCPACSTSLTDAQLRALWSEYRRSKRKKVSGGRKPSCTCGSCRKCKKRAAMQAWRKNIAAK
jgi:hypothetical protein